MKKLAIILLFGIASGIIAMDNAPECTSKNDESPCTLSAKEFNSLIHRTVGDVSELSKRVTQAKTAHGVLSGLIRSSLKDFDPRTEAAVANHDISCFSGLGYNKHTKQAITLTPQQKQVFIALQKMVVEENAYQYSNQLMIEILEGIKANEKVDLHDIKEEEAEEEEEEAPKENRFCAIL